ncbi:putative tail structural protein [Pelagibacter phage HTVC100P]|nr:putative tail structural protein [Pelagibacter phage HTVC100P]
MAITKIPSAGFQDNVKFRNIIINGDMSIAQRSTSVSSLTSSSTYQTIDRYATELGSNGTWTQSQSTDVPTGQGFAKSLKMDCTSTGSGGYLHITQRFEGQNLQYLKKGTSSAESLTLSFWVKSAKTGTYIAEFRDIDNTRNISKSYSISSADTWEKKTITFPGDTSGAFGNDNGSSLELNLWLAAGSGNTSGTLQTNWGSQVAANRAVGQVNLGDSTSNDWYITGIQLEAGTSASDFEFLPNDINKNRCYRYFQKLSVVLMNFNTTGLLGFVFPVEMRANPSVSRSYAGNANRMYNVGTAATADVVSPITIVSNKTIRYWYAFSPSAWAGTSRAGWETEYSIDSEL